jgi:hypothetical protein
MIIFLKGTITLVHPLVPLRYGVDIARAPEAARSSISASKNAWNYYGGATHRSRFDMTGASIDYSVANDAARFVTSRQGHADSSSFSPIGEIPLLVDCRAALRCTRPARKSRNLCSRWLPSNPRSANT